MAIENLLKKFNHFRKLQVASLISEETNWCKFSTKISSTKGGFGLVLKKIIALDGKEFSIISKINDKIPLTETCPAALCHIPILVGDVILEFDGQPNMPHKDLLSSK